MKPEVEARLERALEGFATNLLRLANSAAPARIVRARRRGSVSRHD